MRTIPREPAPSSWSGHRRALTTVATLVALAAAPGRAAAQSTRYPPEPRDLDQDAEEESAFWEQALHPERGLYAERTSRAQRLIESRAPEVWAEAEELLTLAAASEPDLPLAHWLMGALLEQESRWNDCAAAYGRAAAVAPRFEPPGALGRRGFALAYALGVCQGRAGDFEAAIATYEHLVRGGIDNFEVLLRLGEAYMAVGRMDDAIDSLDRATDENAAFAAIRYARAVAYDRDGRSADARAEMERALRLDPQQSQLESPSLSYAPAEDVDYYLGLAREVSALNEAAIFSFRRYLHEAPASPWRRRARRHLEILVASGFGDRVQVTGGEELEIGTIQKILAAADDDLQECLRSTPGLLISARVTLVVTAKPRSGGAGATKKAGARPPPPAGVKALVADMFDTPQEAADTARSCVEGVAASLALPRPDARAGGYLSVVFPVIFRK